MIVANYYRGFFLIWSQQQWNFKQGYGLHNSCNIYLICACIDTCAVFLKSTEIKLIKLTRIQ